MTAATIIRDRDQFEHHLALHLANADHGGVMAAVDVITREGRPEELLLLVRDGMEINTWYSNDRIFTRYRDAFMALGDHLDDINPSRSPLSADWLE